MTDVAVGAARRRSGGGRGGGWGLRLAAVAGCGAADRSVGSASARAAAPGSLAVVPLWVPFMGGSRPARRRSEGGHGGGWGLRLVTVTSCRAADRPIGSASARAAAPGSLAGLPLSDGVGWVKVTVCWRRYFVRRQRHVRQQDSPRVSPRPVCDAGCSMLHAHVVFGRCWACVWRGAGGRGDDGGAGWYALRNEEEASTDAVCSQDCQE